MSAAVVCVWLFASSRLHVYIFLITPAAVFIDLQFHSIPKVQKKPAIFKKSRIGPDLSGDQNL